MSLKSWLLRAWNGPTSAPPAPVSAPEIGPYFPRQPLAVSADFLRRASAMPAGKQRAQMFAELFPVAPAPPGVPKSAEVAMDLCMSSSYEYASLGMFGEGVAWLGYPYLSELAQRQEYRAIFETRAKEMTRKWIELTYADEDADESKKLGEIMDDLKKYRVQDHFRKAAEHDGAFGIGHIYIDTGKTNNPGELQKPLIISPAKIPKGSLKGFHVVEPLWTYPNNYNSLDPLAPDFYRPSSWFVQGKIVHASRLITMVSAEVPDILKATYAFGGVSLSQRAKPYVDNWLRTRQSVSDLVHSFSIVALLTNMMGALGGSGAGDLFDRVDAFNAMRDNRGTFVIDKESEDIKNLAVPLGTLDKLQSQAQEQLLSVSQTPDIKLFGITPSGLNTSTDGVIRVYYDNILSTQEHIFRGALKTVIEIIQLNRYGEIDDKVGFKFVSLWEMDAVAAASVKKTEADMHATYVQEGIIAQEEVRTILANDPDSPYAGINPDDLPEPPESELQETVTGDPAKGAESKKDMRSAV